ncbi:MAG: hypothetical protein LBH32_06645, partial [Dysgonamonadaceae bacterium]|nr:hypothetical protein [Dysgonamonadaceae bacterium]
MKLKLNILTVVLLAVMRLTAYAQSNYPVYVYPVLTPPYSLRLSDYCQPGSQRLSVMIQVRDAMITNLPVRLHIKIETLDGRGIESVPNPFRAMPIYLGGGQTQMLFGEDLAPYFDIDNLIFKGYTKEQYRRTGQLP